MTQPIPIISAPGIKRDGTKFEGDSYVDGQWCRFQRGRPRKMGGFTRTTDTISEIARGIDAYSVDGLNYIHIGSANELQQYVVNSSGNLAGTNDRTPAALVASNDNLWQFAVFWDAVGADSYLIAHAAPNLSNIDNSTTGAIFIAPVDGSGLLAPPAPAPRAVSGGIAVLGPYLFSFGSNGRIGYSGVNDPTTVTDAFITPQKIVRGLPLRGAGTGPAGLFWSLDSLIRAQFVGGATVWQFDHLAETSILSSQGVIEFDGIYYWLGVDRMLMFNGVIRDIPNAFNLNDFYDNVNYAHRQKVFAYKVPRFHEIWWCYPRGSNTECSHAIIYNTKEQTWYDTALPDGGRTAGVYAKVYSKPFMVDPDLTANGYTLWQHETGTDKIQGASDQPILSYFETAEISMLTMQEPMNTSIHVARIEPDFVQTGNMTVRTRGRMNSRAPQKDGETFTFPDVATVGSEETVPMKDTQRLMSFRFESNAVGGHYEMGQVVAHIDTGDERIQT